MRSNETSGGATSTKAPSSTAARAFGPARAVGLLVMVTALVLSPVLLAGYIRLDDYSHLHDNPHLRSSSGLWDIWTRPYFSLYIPITYSVWWAAARIVPIADGAWLFHASSLLLHCVNAGLVFTLVRTWRVHEPKVDKDENATALLAALVFALHPAQVETVAWISELKGELAAAFGLFGLWCHCRARRIPAALCFVAAMLCKPSAIVFPGVVFVVNRGLLGMGLRKSATMPALYAALLAPLVFVTKHLQSDAELDFVPSVAQRLLVASDALMFYVGKTLLPYPLALDYGRSPQFVLHNGSAWGLVGVALPATVLLALSAWALARPGRSLFACGATIFVFALLPVLGFVPFGFQEFSTVADHYLYVPLFGVALMAAGLLTRARTFATSRRIATVCLVVLAGLASQQARFWRSTESLFTHTLRVNPRSYLGAHAIGEEHLHAHRLDQAIEWATRTLAINPDFVKAHIHLGLAWSQKGQLDRAIQVYRSALARKPSTVGTRAKPVASLHNNLGMALLQTGDEASAVTCFRQAIAIFPRSPNAHLNLARVAMANQRYQEAAVELEAVLALDPSSAHIRQAVDQARALATANGNVP